MPGHRIEPFWDAHLAIAAVIGLDTALPSALVLPARWLFPLIGGALLLALMIDTPWNPRTPPRRSDRRRVIALAMLAVVIAAHVGSLGALVVEIVDRSRTISGGELLRAAAQLWAATVLIFAVLFWFLDRGGPIERSHDGPVPRPPGDDWSGPWPDFAFPQMADDAPAPRNWMPGFVDYLYLAATNSTAFSPTDVMPLTRGAKLLMLTQSVTSFVLVALVAARAVNVLA